MRRKDIIEELFTIKDEICMATNQYRYPVAKFITNFVKVFEQKKELSTNYIVNKIKKVSDAD